MTPRVSPGWGCPVVMGRHMALQAHVMATLVPGWTGPGCTWTPHLSLLQHSLGALRPPSLHSHPQHGWPPLALPAVTPMGKPSTPSPRAEGSHPAPPQPHYPSLPSPSLLFFTCQPHLMSHHL